MSETKHTQGKWQWTDKYPTADGRQTWSLINDDGYGILSCDGEVNSPQGLGELQNARLIAKAPELLKWAEEFYDRVCCCQTGNCIFSGNDMMRDELGHLIAEAKGEKQ